MSGPNGVSREEVSSMANLINLLNSRADMNDTSFLGESEDPSISKPVGDASYETVEIKTVDMPLSAGAQSMKRILEMFNDAQADPTEKLTEVAKTSPKLREALSTQKTPTGTRVGSWEIRINEEEGLKNYDVVNVKTGEPIASDLSLYDAAYGLVKCLNEGMTINNVKVRQILSIEAEYLRRRNDAANYKINMQLAERRNDSTKAAIMEDRFDECLSQAKAARIKLNKLVK